MTIEYWWMGYVGLGQIATSPGPSTDSAKWDRPSLEPMVTIDSVSGSRSTSKRRRYQSHTASRSLYRPREVE